MNPESPPNSRHGGLRSQSRSGNFLKFARFQARGDRAPRMVVLRSDSPRFDPSTDPESEARWEAYLALMRRRGALRKPPGAGDRVEDEGGAPLLMAVGALPDPASTHAEPGDAAGDDIQLRSTGHGAPSSRRYARFVAATMALTAGIILAASLMQRPPPEPTVAVWRHEPPPVAQQVAPAQALSLSPQPKPLAGPPARARAAVSVRSATTLAAEASRRPADGAHGRPQGQTPQCWTTELGTGLDPRSLVREARLVNCPLPW